MKALALDLVHKERGHGDAITVYASIHESRHPTQTIPLKGNLAAIRKTSSRTN